MDKYYLSPKVWLTVYEGEGDPPPAATPLPATPPPPPAATPAATTPEKAISQDELNKILATERRKHQDQTKKALEEVSALRSKAQLTTQERHELDKRVEQLQTELLTKEERAKKHAEELKKTHEESVTTLTAERDTWQKRFTDSTIERALTDAAATNNAFSPRQIVAMLGRDTAIAEALDGEGNPTGKLEPRVRFDATDTEGKPVTLQLTPMEAVKRMREQEEYLNLFKGEGAGGIGQKSHPGGKKPNLAELAKDPAAWRRARKEGRVNL